MSIKGEKIDAAKLAEYEPLDAELLPAPVDEIQASRISSTSSVMSIATSQGFRIHSITKTGRVKLEAKETFGVKVVLIERLMRTAVVALVLENEPCELLVYHFKRQDLLAHYKFPSEIISVQMNFFRMAVKTSDSIFVHETKDMTPLHTLKDVPHAGSAICISQSTQNNYLAVSWPENDANEERNGCVKVIDLIDMKEHLKIRAHQSEVSVLQFDSNAVRVATASQRGTIIRVFSAFDGRCLHELRRGLTPSVINEFSFSKENDLLAVSAASGTIHIFQVPLGFSSSAVDDLDEYGNSINNENIKQHKQFVLQQCISRCADNFEQVEQRAFMKLPGNCEKANIALISLEAGITLFVFDKSLARVTQYLLREKELVFVKLEETDMFNLVPTNIQDRKIRNSMDSRDICVREISEISKATSRMA